MEFGFCVTIEAPKGLKGIEKYLEKFSIPLFAWESGFNQKMILRSSNEELVEWGMDSSTTDQMFASGCFFGSSEDALEFITKLSSAIGAAGFSHEILLDNEHGELMKKITYTVEGSAHAPNKNLNRKNPRWLRQIARFFRLA